MVPLDFFWPLGYTHTVAKKGYCERCGKKLPMTVAWQRFCSEKGKNNRSKCANQYWAQKNYYAKHPDAKPRKTAKKKA